MKRKINYRGKRVDNNQWVEGYFFKHLDKCYIAWATINDKPMMTEVVPETVGQFTGMTDYFDVDIYEGDILQSEYGLCIVVFDDISWAAKSPGSEAIDYENRMFFENCSVVGNIHDDTELIEDET